MQVSDKKFLNAAAMGDGCVSKRGNSYRLSITHCLKQKEYIEMKAARLSAILKRPVSIREFNNSGYPGLRIEVCHPYLKFVYQWLYRPKKTIDISFLRRLSDEGVAIWYMDDGSLVAKKRDGKIHAYDLTFSMYVTEQEATNAIQFFKERYDVDFTLKRNKSHFSIRCGTQNARKLLTFLRPFAIPTMEYKFLLI